MEADSPVRAESWAAESSGWSASKLSRIRATRVITDSPEFEFAMSPSLDPTNPFNGPSFGVAPFGRQSSETVA
ncbi:hypothetical protein GCM10025784_00950 [Citricoccus nitrophenolicus]